MRNRAVRRIQSEIAPALKKLSEMRHAILSEDGEVQACSLLSWAYWLEQNRAQRVILQEDLPNGYWISTVFLGLNHQYVPHAPPLWFETMVFEPSDGKPSALTGMIRKHGNGTFCDRYSTLEDARAGHEIIKAKWLGYFNQMAKEKNVRTRNQTNAAIRRGGEDQSNADQGNRPASQSDA